MLLLSKTNLLQSLFSQCSVSFVVSVYVQLFVAWINLSVAVPDDEVRFCYECSGFQCLQNPLDPSLYPGRVRCHPVMDFCTTHVRYTPSNHSIATNASLTARDYSVTSATRSCAKTWLGNTCRRDWLGKPSITCITTCDRDFCNCDTRSPPPEMFRRGQVLPLAPERSTYSERDMMSCRHMDGVPGFANRNQQQSVRLDDDYSYYNDYEVRKATRRRGGRQQTGRRTHHRGHGRRTASNSDVTHSRTQPAFLQLIVISVLLMICTVQMTR